MAGLPPPPPPPEPPWSSPPLPPPPPPGGYSGGAYPPPAPGYGGYGSYASPTDGMAIASLILGLVAFPGLCCYGVLGLVFGVVALILGRVSVSKIKASNGAIGGFGIAQAGWICGLVAAILGAVILLAYVVFFILGVSGAFNNFPAISPAP